MILLWRGCFFDWLLTKGGGGCGWQRGDLSLSQLVAGFLHGAHHRGPVLEVGGEDLGGHVSGQFGNEPVEHDGGVAEFIGQPRPVQVGRFPRLAEETAGIAAKEGEGFYVEDFAAIGSSESGVGDTEVFGENGRSLLLRGAGARDRRAAVRRA